MVDVCQLVPGVVWHWRSLFFTSVYDDLIGSKANMFQYNVVGTQVFSLAVEPMTFVM